MTDDAEADGMTSYSPPPQTHAQEHQPDGFVAHCANQLAMMMEPALMARHRAPADLLAQCMAKLFR